MDDQTEAPVFNLKRLSWKDEKNGTIASQKISQGAANNDMTMTMEGFEMAERYLAKCLVSIPKSWLVDDAPDDIDWSDTESFGWLIGDKFSELMQALQSAKQANQKK